MLFWKLLICPGAVDAFKSSRPVTQLSFTRFARASPRQNIVLRLSSEEESEKDEFVLTPRQFKILRREADSRKHTSKIASLALPPDESGGSFCEGTLSSISQLLDKNELVEVRAICKELKKEARDVSELLAFRLEGKVEKPVVVLNVKGHVAILYTPFEDGHPEKIKLRTSYQKGQWTRKPKVIRDSRGQIIKDEEGNNIRE